MELDLLNLQECWALGNFDERENLKAEGQAFYILGLREDVDHMLADMQEKFE